jgi:hypothetical protein
MRGFVANWLYQSPPVLIESARALFAEAIASIKLEGTLQLLLLGGITVIGIFLRISKLFEPIRFDEATTYTEFARWPLLVGLTSYKLPNNHILHTLAVHFSTEIFGSQPWALRIPALFAGVMMVPASYATARFYLGRASSLYVAALVSASPILVLYSANARGYTMMFLLVLIMIGLLRFNVVRDNAFGWILFVVGAVLGFFTIPIMLYPFGGSIIWSAISAGLGLFGEPVNKHRLIRRLVTASICVAVLVTLLYFPAIVVSSPSRVLNNEIVITQSWDRLLEGIKELLPKVWEQWHRIMPPIAVPVLAVGFLFSIALPLARRRSGLPWLATMLLLWCLPLTLALRRFQPWPRFWLFLLPAYLEASVIGWSLLAHRVLSRTNRRAATVAATASVLVCLIFGISILHASPKSLCTNIDGGINDCAPFAAAAEFTQFLKNRLEKDDKVFSTPMIPGAQSTTRAVLTYYFLADGISIEHLDWEPVELHGGRTAAEAFGPGKRYILVNSGMDPSLDAVLRHAGIARSSIARCSVTWHYGDGTLYLLEFAPGDMNHSVASISSRDLSKELGVCSN